MPDFEALLERTSRTFALCIPLLPEPTRREVGLAYLLFRIADTFEDAEAWPPVRRVAALRSFEALLAGPDPDAARQAVATWLADPPTPHPGYLALLRETPAVLAAFAALRPRAREAIGHHLCRTTARMAAFVARTGPDGRLVLRDLDDLRAYCYAVAGLVGEMLTDLFLLDRPSLAPHRAALRTLAPRFGEGLQLTNILKDAGEDAAAGRQFLPPGVPVADVRALARAGLDAAVEYTRTLRDAGAPRGLVAACALPVLLARPTLDRLEEGGAKLTREEVMAMVLGLHEALDAGCPLFPA